MVDIARNYDTAVLANTATVAGAPVVMAERPAGRSTAPPSPIGTASLPDPATNMPARYLLAGIRIAMGFIFLWAFLDKVFGLGFATTSDKSWLAAQPISCASAVATFRLMS